MLDKIALIEERLQEIDDELMTVGEDYTRAAELGKERSEIEPVVLKGREYRQAIADLEETRALQSGDDQELAQLASMEIEELEPAVECLGGELKSMLLPKDPRDRHNVIMEIRAGAGGDEAGLFAADLYRMYTRHAEHQGWKTEVLSSNETGVGGFKEIIFMVKGKGAFSRLKFESGVHRVQRVPTTESQGRIHTSTATVAVLAEVDEVEIDIQKKMFAWTRSNRRVQVVKVCKKMPPRCGLPTSPPGWSSPVRTSGRSCKTACAP